MRTPPISRSRRAERTTLDISRFRAAKFVASRSATPAQLTSRPGGDGRLRAGSGYEWPAIGAKVELVFQVTDIDRPQDAARSQRD